MRSLLSLFCLAPFVGMTACGGDPFTAKSTDAGADGSTLTDDQACGDNARAHCLRIEACSAEQMTTVYGDEGTCETRLKLLCLNSLAAPSAGNDAQKSEACALAYPSWSCTDYLDVTNPPAACAQAKGGLASGQPCGSPGQCQTGFCAIAPGSACGVCAPVPQPGASCAALTTCGQLLFCDAVSQLCTGFAPSGGACTRTQPCGAGLFCVGSTATTSGVCQPAVEQAGASCDPTGKTGAGCDRLAGLTCNSGTSQCATIQFAATGQACGTVSNQVGLCASAGTCMAAAGADASAGETCVPTAPDGAACNLVTGPFCRSPARCITSGDSGTEGTCQFADPASCH